MEKIIITNVERSHTEREHHDCYNKAVTFTRWTFNNGVTVSIMRHVMAFSDTEVCKSIVVMPIGGITKSYYEVRKALRVAEKAAHATFPGWKVEIQL